MWLLQCGDNLVKEKLKLIATLLQEPLVADINQAKYVIRHESATTPNPKLPTLFVFDEPNARGISLSASIDDWYAEIGKLKADHTSSNLIGTSAQIARVRSLVERSAPYDVCVLITGASGTGKEVVARELHRLSNRANEPFVAVNCGAIPSELLESELFGHEKGAFTGATNPRAGKFEQAGTGTIFLDEIGEMPLNMQVKLLRVLQERTIERVGSSQSLPMRARIIAATNQDMETAIQQGKVREDLYFRLNVFPIEMPALKDRLEDLDDLIAYFAKTIGFKGRVFSSSAYNALCAWHWPGNIRELYNLLERLYVLKPEGGISLQELPANFQTGKNASFSETIITAYDQPLDLKAHVVHIEKDLINKSLALHNGVVAKAAKHLGLRRTTLVEKMRKYGIQAKRLLSQG